MIDTEAIIDEYKTYLSNKAFPCVGAKAALAHQHIQYMVADHMACPKDDQGMLQFLYGFVDHFRKAANLFHSAVILFKGPEIHSEEMFDGLLWQRLQALADLDAKNYSYDKRVDADPSAPNFSFSLKEEAFFVIGLHACSSRPARQFRYPTLAFNPHAQFEKMRETNSYARMKHIVRKRDVAYSGSVNPMLQDFGKVSEVYQYSGRQYSDQWQCPLRINHAKNEHHSSA